MIIEHRTYTLPHGGWMPISRATANWRCRCRCATWAVCWDSSSATSARSIRCCTSGPTTAWPTAKPPRGAGGRSGLAGIQARQSRDLRGAAGVDLARGVVQSATGLARHGHVRFHAHQPIAAHAAGRRPGRLADRAPVRRPRDRPHRRDRRPDALYVDLEHSPVAAIRQPHLQRHPRGGRDAAGARARPRCRVDRPRAGRRRARHHRAAGRIGRRRGAGRGLAAAIRRAAAVPTPADRRRWATATRPRPRLWRRWTPAC